MVATNLGGCFSGGSWVPNSSLGPGANLDVFVVGRVTAHAAQMHSHPGPWDPCRPYVRWPRSVRVVGDGRLTSESGDDPAFSDGPRAITRALTSGRGEDVGRGGGHSSVV